MLPETVDKYIISYKYLTHHLVEALSLSGTTTVYPVPWYSNATLKSLSLITYCIYFPGVIYCPTISEHLLVVMAQFPSINRFFIPTYSIAVGAGSGVYPGMH